MKKLLIILSTGLRLLVGWHLLYEGIIKLVNPAWSAKIYLASSNWIFSGLFHRMADSAVTMEIVDFLNVWGLILIGLALILGLFVRWFSMAGAALLLLYFFAHPPIPGHTFGAVVEGNYLWVNKNLIEFAVLLVFSSFSVDFLFGLDRLIYRWKQEKARPAVPVEKDDSNTNLQRRELIRDLIGLPVVGAFAYALYKKRKWDSFEEKLLGEKVDSVSGATLKSHSFSDISNLKGQVPKVKIGDMELSRLIMGGNLIGGWAHARDLIYASKLVKAYFTDDKVMQTLQLAETCGINAFLTNPYGCSRIINKYWHETGSKMKFISDCGGYGSFKEGIIASEKSGASAMYCHGGVADFAFRDGKLHEVAEGLELIRSYGKPAGIGAHRIETIKGCVELGIIPDFWMKTLHHHNYWSARVDADPKSVLEKDFPDNIFCMKPDETIDFMNTLEQPWIGFKVLAAGAIEPIDGFKYAFENGADFIVAGMYDFQIVDDVNITLDILDSDSLKQKRKRPWYA